MLIVPLNNVPSQSLNVQLNGQNCTLNVFQKFGGLFFDLILNGTTLVIGGVLCENLNRIVRDLYFGFLGDFVFLDTQGNNDPMWTSSGNGLGTRYVLVYLGPSDLPPGVG